MRKIGELRSKSFLHLAFSALSTTFLCVAYAVARSGRVVNLGGIHGQSYNYLNKMPKGKKHLGSTQIIIRLLVLMVRLLIERYFRALSHRQYYAQGFWSLSMCLVVPAHVTAFAYLLTRQACTACSVTLRRYFCSKDLSVVSLSLGSWRRPRLCVRP